MKSPSGATELEWLFRAGWQGPVLFPLACLRIWGRGRHWGCPCPLGRGLAGMLQGTLPGHGDAAAGEEGPWDGSASPRQVACHIALGCVDCSATSSFWLGQESSTVLWKTLPLGSSLWVACHRGLWRAMGVHVAMWQPAPALLWLGWCAHPHADLNGVASKQL